MSITISGQNNNDKILASDGVLDSISGFNVVGVMTAAQFDVTGKTTIGHLNIGSDIQIGNAGIITATTLVGNVQGNINHTSNLLLQISGSEKLRIANSGAFGLNGTNYGSSGQVLTSQGSGTSPTWSTVNIDLIQEGNTQAEVVDTGSDGHFKVITEGTERLRITQAGQMVMGATTSKAKFEIKDNGYTSTSALQRISADDDTPYALIIANDTVNTGSVSGLQFFVGNTGTHMIRARGSSTASNNNLQLVAQNEIILNSGASESERVRITSGGRFGIGETSPDTPLHVKSADNVLATFESTDADALIEFKDNGTSDTVLMGAVGGNDLLFRTDLGDMIFRTNNNATDALRIHNNGNISAHVNNDSYELTLQGRTGAAPTLWLRDGGTSGMPRIMFGDTGNALQGAIQYNNGDDSLRIHTGGEGSNPRLLVTNVGEVRILPTTNGSDRTQFSFNNTSHTPFISFKSNNVNEAAEMRVEEDGGGANIVFKNKNRNSLLHTAFQIDWDHGLYTAKDGNVKTYPFIMGMYTQHDEHEGQFNYHDVRSPSGGIGGWVFLGFDYGANPYPVRRFKIAAPENAQGTRVYQVWHDGDANYDYGGLYEIRINQWANSSRFESVSIRCINGKRDDLRVVAYNDSNGIMIQTSTIWGAVYIRKAGWDDNQRRRGSSYCAVENNGALAIYNALGTDDGTMPSGGTDVYCFDGVGGSHTGGRDIENSNNFNG